LTKTRRKAVAGKTLCEYLSALPHRKDNLRFFDRHGSPYPEGARLAALRLQPAANKEGVRMIQRGHVLFLYLEDSQA
jgi:hypothetical protein